MVFFLDTVCPVGRHPQKTAPHAEALRGNDHILGHQCHVLDRQEQQRKVVGRHCPAAFSHNQFHTMHVHAKGEPQRRAERRFLAREQHAAQLRGERRLLPRAHDCFDHLVGGLLIRVLADRFAIEHRFDNWICEHI